MTRERTRVLVVDDEADIREELRDILEGEGFKVSTAADAHSALDLAEKHSPHVALVDLVMPEMDGWALIPALAERFPDVTVFVMTAGRMGTVPTGYPAFVKPLNVPDLIHALRAAAAPRTDHLTSSDVWRAVRVRRSDWKLD